eukprot:CAMPEP_0114505350 /NCGR_PEP_ID=MMETSP0109-20121206/10808_1 /TAXON_ID=29199 /ORGANISM="Chlorarachnion reptans, Strain CCCM449" /LENGTH=1068 /DNA_ID=CAMNT_0001683787 /DNA_START=195 /DNA_END=3401 /DNA_ORIENTATION=+
MKRSNFVECDDPLAGLSAPAAAPKDVPDSSTASAAQTARSASKTGSNSSIPQRSTVERNRANVRAGDGEISPTFGDAAWLQSEFIRMPVARRTYHKEAGQANSSNEKKQLPVRRPVKPNRSRDKSLDSQLSDDIRIGPNGDVIFLPGEDELMRLEDKVLWPQTAGLLELAGAGPRIIPPAKRIREKSRGSFVTTNYRLYYLRRRAEDSWQLDPKTHIPLGEIDRIDIKENRYRRKGPTMYLELGCKGVRIIKFGFVNSQLCERARDLLSTYVFAKVELSFAFSYKLDHKINPAYDGWKIYDLHKEYARMGLPDAMFRISEANVEYKLSPTYPRYFVCPSTVSDEDLHSIAKFRSRGRIPALVWRDHQSGATIWRCSQPRVGLQYSRNKSDEELFERIHQLNGGKKLIVFDARPLKNALANQAAGKGYENSSFYRNTEVQFMNIENIHVVRGSYQAARNAVLSCAGEPDGRFHLKFEQSGWLKHLRIILKATCEMVARVKINGASIVSHCSDGWDRTAQLIASTELCLDPYFRSVDGFFCLIEKEWISFGHQFYKRLGHTKPAGDQDISPIFVQWLDCVWQITRQHPTAFQFNSKMLRMIAYHATSLRFGTFLFDTDRERQEKKVPAKTVSLWTFLKASAAARKGEFTNPFYAPQKGLVLFPAYDSVHVGVWTDFWYQHCYSSVHVQIAKDRLPPYTVHASQLPTEPFSETMVHSVGHAVRKQLGLHMRKRQAAEKEIEKLKAEVARLKALVGESQEEALDSDQVIPEKKAEGADPKGDRNPKETVQDADPGETPGGEEHEREGADINGSTVGVVCAHGSTGRQEPSDNPDTSEEQTRTDLDAHAQSVAVPGGPDVHVDLSLNSSEQEDKESKSGEESKKNTPQPNIQSSCIGTPSPDLSRVDWLSDLKEYPKPSPDRPLVLLVWRRTEVCYPYIALYSKLQEKFKEKVCVIGVSVDEDASHPREWLGDPNGCYSTVHRTKFAIVHDKDGSVKKYLQGILGGSLRVPHAFVLANEIVAWHQQHSADTPTFMSLMEQNVQNVLDGKPVVTAWEQTLELQSNLENSERHES